MSSEVHEVNQTHVWWHRAIAAVGVLALVGACGRALDTRNPKRRSAAMVLLDGATDVTYYLNHDAAGHEELEGLSYHLSLPFPGAKVICAVTDALAKEGWRPIDRLNDDRGTASSYLQGWRVVTRHDNYRIDLWDAEWVNDAGDQLSYSLTYASPPHGTSDRSSMQIGGIRTPARYAMRRSRGAGTGSPVSGERRPRISPSEDAACAPGPGR
jgi:hypothetical protein